jgi:23S rRNA G2445 N2-methylase RlmL
MVLPGLEPVAAEEIARDLGGDVSRTSPGVVVFRRQSIDRSFLELRTVEDVFLLAWGTDQLTYRAEDLDRIRRWTARQVDWNSLLRIHHDIRPKPKAKPTYRLVTQMTGEHGYRRIDAGKALAAGLAGKLPASWRPAEENAAVEIWLTIQGATAVCGLRLSDRSMRHRSYKAEHVAASLRPTMAAAMLRVAALRLGQELLDPMCGAGTFVAEALQFARGAGGTVGILAGDIDISALRAAKVNLRRLGSVPLIRWNAERLPLEDRSVDRIVSNPPFGKKHGRPEEIAGLYQRVLKEYDRVLRPGGIAVLLVSDRRALREAAKSAGWTPIRQLRVRVLGQSAEISAWRKA